MEKNFMPSMIAALSLILLFALTALGQTDRGTITGTVSDASAAVIPGVGVVATNTQTGTEYETISTETGNYTLTQLPAGIYELTAELPGFKRYVRQGITVLVAQTLRVDILLEVGSTNDTITVTADASLLRTESADTVHDVNTARLNDLPILGIGQAGAGSVGIRNPLASLELMPGTLYSGNNTVRINGTPNNTESIRVDGQEADNAFGPFATQLTQPSVDAVQEVTVQASNFAAEFGETGSAVVNYTTRSGTNQFHGSVYDSIVNEVLNAGVPFTTTGGKANQRERARRHDWGFNGGGPVRLGKLYDGQNRTFFFANWEQFRETIRFTSLPQTVPTLKMRNGDFSEVLTGRQLGTDPLGRPIMEGTIYDPATTRIVNGQVVRDPFPNNVIPRDRWDPVAVKIQALVPAPTNNALLNNVFPNLNSQRITGVLSFKGDYNLTAGSKLSGYYQHTETDSQFIPTTGQADGFPAPITTARGSFTETNLWRLNWDHSLSPTLLLHIGAGFMLQDFKDRAPTLDFNGERELGLKGATLNRNFPQFRGLLTNRGGLKDLGPGGQTRLRTERPTSNASLTWVKNNHTYKFGGEWRFEGFPTTTFSTFATSAAGRFNFSGAETGLPFLQSTTLNGGLVGFPYASFLLGLAGTGDLAAVSRFRFGRQIWSGFAQDTWKVTPTFTLDYGLRYDFATAFEEQFGRQANFAPDLPNPSASGALGAAIFEGGNVTEGRCGCDFANNYGWAFGPRIGAAWRFMPKTVLRLGYGIVYDQPADTRTGVSSSNPFSGPGFGEPATRLQVGIPLTAEQVRFPKIDPGVFPVVPGVIQDFGGVAVDHNAGRPARIMQWTVGLQREITPDLLVEAAYVGNRGAWWPSTTIKNINALTPERLASFGLDLDNAADRQLLRSPVNSPLAAQRGFNTPPFEGFPVNRTVAQALRPFPQFNNIPVTGAPLGNTWYDALQVKVTQRLSRGLSFNIAYTWQKELQEGLEGAAISDVFDREQNKSISGSSRPQTFVVAANYQFPSLPGANPVLSTIFRGWTYGAVLRYASGLPIPVPNAQTRISTLLGTGNTRANRVPGEPLFLKDLNDGTSSIDPKKDFVLNPNAWTDPPDGQFGSTGPFISGFRFQRRPQESMSLGRIFRITEEMNAEFRVELDNVFNRPVINNPDTVGGNFRAPQQRDANGNVVSGFGRIPTGTALSGPGFTGRPREGRVVLRFRF